MFICDSIPTVETETVYATGFVSVIIPQEYPVGVNGIVNALSLYIGYSVYGTIDMPATYPVANMST